MSVLRRAAIAAAFLTAFADSALADTTLPPVKTDAGLVTGNTRDGINRYFGIPYAAAPVGENRWHAPQPVKPWKGVKQATEFGPVCVQAVNWIKSPQSEDCLSLNIWAPAKKAKRAYPVMIWIHGGGLFGGSGSQFGRDGGDAYVRQGVILVTINYRLGVLGFFAHPELSAESPYRGSGNQGFLDQIAALGWVQHNIKAFGGDANRVTIVGESAGASSVTLLSGSPLAKGLFHGAIAESGMMSGGLDRATAEKNGADFAAAHGGLVALRTMSAEKLIQLPGMILAANVDGYLISDSLEARKAAQQEDAVPFMVGWNADEGKDLAPELLGITKDFKAADYIPMLKRIMGQNPPAEFLKAYPGNTDAEALESVQRFTTDFIMGMQMWGFAMQQKVIGKAPAYVYYFLHWPVEPTTPCGYGCKAGHGAEIRFAFGQLDQDKRSWSADDRALEAQMVCYWTNFAKTGDPNGASLPRWTAFNGNSDSVLRLGTNDEIEARGKIQEYGFTPN